MATPAGRPVVRRGGRLGGWRGCFDAVVASSHSDPETKRWSGPDAQCGTPGYQVLFTVFYGHWLPLLKKG